MDTEASTLAFKTAINEIKNTCPGISNIFILDTNGQIITQDENTEKELMNCAADSLTSLLKNENTTGNLEAFTCTGESRNINFTRYETNYFVTVASSETDERAITTLARVMVPSMLKLAQEVIASRNQTAPETPEPKTLAPPPTPTPAKEPEPAAPQIIPISRLPSSKRTKPSVLDLPASEYTVENLTGINIISSDPETIYVDRVLLGEWKELYGDKHIESALVESTDTKKKTRCKFQPTKTQKFEGQNIVQIPNRIQNKLEIKKGATVLIRPMIEEGEE